MAYDFERLIFMYKARDKALECNPLRVGEVVLRFAVIIYATDQTDADAVCVVSLCVGSGLFDRTALFELAITTYNIVVAYAEEAASPMPTVYLCRAYVHAWLCGGAVNYYGVNVSYFLSTPLLPVGVPVPAFRLAILPVFASRRKGNRFYGTNRHRWYVMSLRDVLLGSERQSVGLCRGAVVLWLCVLCGLRRENILLFQ